MFKEEDALAGNNDEEYLRHFGFTVEDLSFLISPQSSLSPIKKKQRNVFNFEAFGEEIDRNVPPVAAGPYPANFPTVYEQAYVQSSPSVNIKEEDEDPRDEPLQEQLPSFDGLDLTSFEVSNSDEYMEGPTTYGSNYATSGSGTSTIATEQIDIGFSRMGSSMGMGSLNFSTMSSFNFDETDADELLGTHAHTIPDGVAAGSANSYKSNGNNNMDDRNNMQGLPYSYNTGRSQQFGAPLPPLPSIPPPNQMCLEDASYIINAQQQQLQHQQYLLQQQQRAFSNANSNNNSWNQQDFQRSGLLAPSGDPGSQPLSRIGSFKSTLPPLSVDMNALNAAHHAHQQAKLYYQTHGGGVPSSGNNSHNNSVHSLTAFHSNLSSSGASGRSSGASSPDRGSYLSDSGRPNTNTNTKKQTEKERRSSFGNTRNNDDASGLAVALLSLHNPQLTHGKQQSDKSGDKNADKGEDTRASKSLATISRRFVEHFGEANTFDYISGLLHVNDVHGELSPAGLLFLFFFFVSFSFSFILMRMLMMMSWF